MNYNFRKNKLEGDQTEKKFEDLCLYYNIEIKKSSLDEDKYKHIDYYVKIKQKCFTSVDVKSIKKVNGEYNDDLYYIELTNDYGYKGWIYSKDLDIIAFENKNEFNLYRRKDILDFIHNTDITKYKEVKRKLYFLDTFSKCILLPKKDIEHFKYYQLKKQYIKRNTM